MQLGDLVPFASGRGASELDGTCFGQRQAVEKKKEVATLTGSAFWRWLSHHRQDAKLRFRQSSAASLLSMARRSTALAVLGSYRPHHPYECRKGTYSILKSGMKGGYQQRGGKHLHRYLPEFEFEFEFSYISRRAHGFNAVTAHSKHVRHGGEAAASIAMRSRCSSVAITDPILSKVINRDLILDTLDGHVIKVGEKLKRALEGA